MSVIIHSTVYFPPGWQWLGMDVGEAAGMAAHALGLHREESRPGRGNSVDLSVDLSGQVEAGGQLGRSVSFAGKGVRATVFLDAEGKAAIRVSGEADEEELRALGEEMAGRMLQQYAYHRLITELRARNITIVDEETEADGTVRLRARVLQG